MISLKGPGIKISATILALLALAAGIWMTFIQSRGYVTTQATIFSISEDPNYIPDQNTENDKQYIVKVKYNVDGRDYIRELDSYSPTYKEGDTVEIKYDPNDPSKIHSGGGFGIYLIIAGGVILLIILILTVKKNMSVKQVKNANADITYAPSEQGGERELYFITDTGTPKYGHRIEDRNRRVLYEAKMTKFTMANPFGFDFIDHEKNTVTPHLIGHEEESDWNSLLIDNHYTFTIDGEDIWKHLKRNGITVKSKLGADKVPSPSYTVLRDGQETALVETTSQYVHEEDEEEHKIAGKIPVRGFYRIYTNEKNLDLLFVTVLAFARSGATDDKGGSRKILFNTLKNN